MTATCASNASPWYWRVTRAGSLPYILQLAGEYVVEIVDDIARAIASRDAAPLAAFVRENPDYMATLERRIMSYWSCHHRHAYPERPDYPGFRLAACLRRLME
ncbi:hypothetical protein [Massilia sp. ST3]|uniref:hypothetical protein n=1 Tax=Massilia sp. ST3 TaxID=2824903 RepID=UPI001B811ED8|nr:hypothetical protein [Massilia sp. ST3]MBQ5949244.1 hypothetical protein [Massilia sp. ST3]